MLTVFNAGPTLGLAYITSSRFSETMTKLSYSFRSCPRTQTLHHIDIVRRALIHLVLKMCV